jgi:hypothetical protein
MKTKIKLQVISSFLIGIFIIVYGFFVYSSLTSLRESLNKKEYYHSIVKVEKTEQRHSKATKYYYFRVDSEKRFECSRAHDDLLGIEVGDEIPIKHTEDYTDVIIKGRSIHNYEKASKKLYTHILVGLSVLLFSVYIYRREKRDS